MNATTLIAVGVPRGTLTTLYRDVTQVGVVDTPLGIDTDETGRPTYLCRGPKVSLDSIWPSLQSFH